MKPYYQHDGITIYHGDARDILPELEPVDLVLTDPPYGVTQNDWDSFDVCEMWALLKNARPTTVVMTAQQPFTTDCINAARDWFKWADVWHKTQARGHLNAHVMPLREHEDVLVFAEAKATFNPVMSKKPKWNVRPVTPRTKQTGNYGNHGLDSERTASVNESFPRSVMQFANSQDGHHPTQKPLALFRLLVSQYSNASDTILDPFMGSGTTLVAAKLEGREAIGIELEERYCEIAANRLRQGVLF